ncbi:hypothetical protein BKA62DRAFT_674881 [Auriculariales sp. MPI-PUGE-AT-0066]|nr:hypothetical protein BKA62DRAFT_674881 [Auriculariales sp. MPI-PUGE-AT-0066]
MTRDMDAPVAAAVHKDDEHRTTTKQVDFIVPGLTIKDLLSAIPAHCTKRSALRSGVYVVWDVALIYGIYRAATAAEAFIAPAAGNVTYPHPAAYTLLWTALWALYSWASGLVMTGLWVIAHECGHQAFSESKFINNSVGWVLHSAPRCLVVREQYCWVTSLLLAIGHLAPSLAMTLALTLGFCSRRCSLGVPYHSWRITHAKHHASTGHVYQDQVFLPRTRSELGLPKFDPSGEELLGSSISDKIMAELYDALGDSPIGAVMGSVMYLVGGWPLYLIKNVSGQLRYPSGTNHFVPKAPLFAPHQFWQIIMSDLGIALWIGAMTYWSMTRGVGEMLRLYFFGYLWVNHNLVLITFLQHTDPLLPHYRPPVFTFARGALTTFDRSFLGNMGPIMAWIGAGATHGISETHVLHHVSSKIPHYHAWEAARCLKKRLQEAGIVLEGRPGGWSEMYRVLRECRFIEDEGSVVFYKNAKGLAAARPVFPDGFVSDSGVDTSVAAAADAAAAAVVVTLLSLVIHCMFLVHVAYSSPFIVVAVVVAVIFVQLIETKPTSQIRSLSLSLHLLGVDFPSIGRQHTAHYSHHQLTMRFATPTELRYHNIREHGPWNFVTITSRSTARTRLIAAISCDSRLKLEAPTQRTIVVTGTVSVHERLFARSRSDAQGHYRHSRSDAQGHYRHSISLSQVAKLVV